MNMGDLRLYPPFATGDRVRVWNAHALTKCKCGAPHAFCTSVIESVLLANTNLRLYYLEGFTNPLSEEEITYYHDEDYTGVQVYHNHFRDKLMNNTGIYFVSDTPYHTDPLYTVGNVQDGKFNPISDHHTASDAEHAAELLNTKPQANEIAI